MFLKNVNRNGFKFIASTSMDFTEFQRVISTGHFYLHLPACFLTQTHDKLKKQSMIIHWLYICIVNEFCHSNFDHRCNEVMVFVMCSILFWIFITWFTYFLFQYRLLSFILTVLDLFNHFSIFLYWICSLLYIVFIVESHKYFF